MIKYELSSDISEALGSSFYFFRGDKGLPDNLKGMSQIYAQSGEIHAKVPLIHPYHPSDKALNCLTVHLGDQLEILPKDLQEIVEKNQKLRIYLVIQRTPDIDGRNNKKAPLLLRPHYYFDPDAPTSGEYSKSLNMKPAIFNFTNNVKINDPKLEEEETLKATIHNTKNSYGQVVLSPNNMDLVNLSHELVENNEGIGFWTYFKNEKDNNQVITLHWMATDRQADHLLKKADELYKKHNLQFKHLVTYLTEDDIYKDTGLATQLLKMFEKENP